MTEAFWHVHFDDKPQLIGHICGPHRAVGDFLICPERRPDGNCDHVQLVACDCSDTHQCDACAALPVEVE